MSKSIRKTPILKDNGRSKKQNRAIANRIVRRKLKNLDYEIADGTAYKKEFESYNIADYVRYWSEEDARREYATNQFIDRNRFPTLESFLIFWKKCMKRK